MSFTRFALCAAIVAFSATSVALADNAMSSGPSKLTIVMKAENGSKENGTAVITPSKDGVNVVVMLDHAKNLSQPTHIHVGTCDNINKAPEYALSNSTNGISKTDVKGVTIAQLLAGKFAINVHKSAADLATYVSCGNITK